jgi:transcriptional regulator with GAF, ATPase, and Fis domain
VDARLIAATNRNLEREIKAGRFREDLYYRLSVFPIEIPPLRQRTGDIPIVAAQFLQQARPPGYSGKSLRLTPEQIERLQQYDWPGKIRELQNVLERALIVSRAGPLRLDLALRPFTPTAAESTPVKTEATEEPEFVSAEDWKQRERQNLQAALKRANWRIYGPGGAAELLGLQPTTLTSRMRAMKIKRLPAKKSGASE